MPSCSLVASGIKEEVEKGKVKKCLSRHPCRQCREGQPNPELPSNIIYHPHPSEARSPAQMCSRVLHRVLHRCGLHHEENVLFGGCHMQLRAPAHVCAVPGDTPACSASLTVTINAAQHSRSPARPRARSPAHPRVQPPPWGGASLCCIGPSCSPHMPAGVREAHTKTSG